MARSFALGSRFEAFIDEEVQSGRFGDPDDVVREGLRLLERQSYSIERTDELRRLVEEARDDPALVDADEIFDRLENKFRAAIEEGNR